MDYLAFLKVLLLAPVVLYQILETLVKSLIPKKFRYKNLDGETILITGAGSGIGRELAKKLSAFDVTLVLLDINLKGLNDTADAIPNIRKVKVYECDLCDRQQVYDIANRIKSEVGTVTVLVNNAGFVTGRIFLECPDDLMQRTMDVNIMAHFWTCKAYLPDMISSNHGHIVNVASAAGYFSLPKVGDYCASKFAVVGFSEALRLELYQQKFHGVKVTTIAPGLVSTELFKGTKYILDEITPEYVACQIVSSIRLNKETAFIPNFLSVCIAMLRLLPSSSQRLLLRVTGMLDSTKGLNELHV